MDLKGIADPKMTFLSSFIHPSVEHETRIYETFTSCSFRVSNNKWGLEAS